MKIARPVSAHVEEIEMSSSCLAIAVCAYRIHVNCEKNGLSFALPAASVSKKENSKSSEIKLTMIRIFTESGRFFQA
jgi:hypothetical protein